MAKPVQGSQTEAFGNFWSQGYTAVVTVVVVVTVAVVLVKKVLGGKPTSKIALKKDEFIPFVLQKKIIVSPDTRIFRFALQSPEHTLGLPIGQHVMVQASIKGTDVQRPYTPISSDDEKGYIDLLIKVYKAGVHPRFPDGGLMSQHMDTLVEGQDTLKFRGPNGRFEYKGKGKCHVKGAERTIKHFAMIGGGTGITPLFQVLKAILKDSDDKTTVSLIFANQTEDDILMRADLEEASKDPRVKVWYTLDRPPVDWKYSAGFINQAMVEEHLPAPSDDALVLMCGPPVMISAACKPNLEKVGFNNNHFVVF